MKRVLIVIAIFAIVVFGWRQYASQTAPTLKSGVQTPMVADLNIPEFSSLEMAGKGAFEANCAACHGVNGAGNDGAGPPLIHVIYEPNHHGDGSFVVAARNGVRAHHWKFGNMPPVQGVKDDEIVSIIAYIRKLQRANGIN